MRSRPSHNCEVHKFYYTYPVDRPSGLLAPSTRNEKQHFKKKATTSKRRKPRLLMLKFLYLDEVKTKYESV